MTQPPSFPSLLYLPLSEPWGLGKGAKGEGRFLLALPFCRFGVRRWTRDPWKPHRTFEVRGSEGNDKQLRLSWFNFEKESMAYATRALGCAWRAPPRVSEAKQERRSRTSNAGHALATQQRTNSATRTIVDRPKTADSASSCSCNHTSLVPALPLLTSRPASSAPRSRLRSGSSHPSEVPSKASSCRPLSLLSA